jgi:hypothetical protein
MCSKYIGCFFLLVYFNIPLSGQILKDTCSLKLIKQGVDEIYNCQFDKANDVYGKLQSTYPGHPVLYLYRGMMTYWKYFPLTPSSHASQTFRNDMLTCIDLCEERRLLPGEPEFLLADIGARGLLLTYFSDNDLKRKMIPMASKTYQDVMRSFDYTGLYADFYFVTGLYKYYRETYPIVHPVYQLIAKLFPEGNREEGLTELKIAAQNAIFLKAEAYSFLSGIFIGYENNYPAAYQYSKSLFEQYPLNNEFLAIYVKNLLLMKRYDEAEKMLSQNRDTENLWFQVQKTIFQAVIQEKKYHNLEQAESLYKTGIYDAGEFSDFANEYLSFSYFGLSRIMKVKREIRLSNSYHKKAIDLATSKEINFND